MINSPSVYLPIEFGEVQTKLFPPTLLDWDRHEGQPNIVVLIHGLEGGPTTFDALKDAIAIDDWFVTRLVYPNDGGVDGPGDFLRESLQEVASSAGVRRIIVIGHSMGGLVAWRALSSGPGERPPPPEVTDLVAIGTPFGGSALAAFGAELEVADLLYNMVRFDRDRLDWRRDGGGEAAILLSPNSELRTTLLDQPVPDRIRIHVVVGRGGPITEADRPRWREGLRRRLQNPEISEAFKTQLQILINAEELIDSLGDGAVTVQSSRAAPRIDRTQQFDTSHTGLLDAASHPEVWAWVRDGL